MADLIGVVEAAYAFERDEYTWLREVLERAAPMLDHGIGAFANTFEVDSRERLVTRASVFVGLPDTEAPVVQQTGLAIPPAQVAQFIRMGVSTMSELWGAPADEIEHHREPAANIGAHDFLGVIARNPVGHSVVLGAPLPGVTRLDAAFKRRWSRVAAHIAAAARMRQKLGAVVSPT